MGKQYLGIEKRAKILYVRVRPSVREYIRSEAERQNLTESALVDKLLGSEVDTSDAKKLFRPRKAPSRS